MSSGERSHGFSTHRFAEILATAVALLVVSSAVVTPVAGAVAPGSSANTSATQTKTISSCPKAPITQSGVYTLTSNLTNSTADGCIEIDASDVVIDGNGHTLTGTGEGNLSAFYASSAVAPQKGTPGIENVTIKNVRAEGWTRSVWVRRASDVTVTDSHLRDGLRGVVFYKVNDSSVTDVTATQFAEGVVFWTARNTTVARNNLSDNDGRGIHVGAYPFENSSSRRVRIVNNTLNHNFLFGAFVSQASEYTTIENNTAVGNRLNGINVTNGSDHTAVADNTVLDTTGDVGAPFGQPSGIAVSDSKHVKVVGNTVQNNSGNGINVTDTRKFPENSSSVTVTSNSVRGNALHGIRVEGSPQTGIGNNTIVANRLGGILLEDSPASLLSNNDVSAHLKRADNTSTGLELRGDYRNVNVFDNGFQDNWVGVEVANGSHGPAIRSNRIETNNYAGVLLEAGAPANRVQIHNNNLGGNVEYGVYNHEDNAVVNATGNYWGEASGPSSNSSDSDAPFEDPDTGALASGNGSAVSEGSTAGVSNVQFDPAKNASAATGSSPGFTPATVVVALLALALLALRPREESD
ncbi:right-handed parallel beta-helix repeat-containing protein [Halorussus lipolyticus]|uniref:right-handed parallel beta-helix repeat-containing protein n=1 Tax=Halorussus lipolyticus TaxID=3034024 RepID=UPI0023E8F2D8|nr:right-handed parallel beta-helix repeat-containing protein [Halorussus sp. DT80]